MSNDRWVSNIILFAPKGTKLAERVIEGFPPLKGEESVSTTTLHSARLPDVKTYSVAKRGKHDEEYLACYLVAQEEDANTEVVGIYIDSKGRFPRTQGSDCLEAIGITRPEYGEEDSISVMNTLGIPLSHGLPHIGFKESLHLYLSSGTGFLFLLTNVGGNPITQAEMGKHLPPFHAIATPAIEIDTEIKREALAEALDMEIPNDSVIVLSNTIEGDVRVVGTYRRADKLTPRRIARDVTVESERVMESIIDLVTGGYMIDSRRVEETAKQTEVEKNVQEEMQEEIDSLKRQLRRSEENRRAAERDYREALRAIPADEQTPDVSLVEKLPETPAEETETESAIYAQANRDRVFLTFSDIAEAAEADLDFIRILPGAFDPIQSIASDNRAGSWRSATWSALLALNEYGERELRGEGNGLHSFLLDHPHPTISRKRYAPRESDTVRATDRLIRERYFTVDGESVLMEAHFKIDPSGSHPAPRMHFSLIEGVPTIGYVGPHLRTKATN